MGRTARWAFSVGRRQVIGLGGRSIRPTPTTLRRGHVVWRVYVWEVKGGLAVGSVISESRAHAATLDT